VQMDLMFLGVLRITRCRLMWMLVESTNAIGQEETLYLFIVHFDASAKFDRCIGYDH